MNWYRIVLDKRGRVTSCHPCEAQQRGTRTILYINAMAPEVACARAEAWFAQKKERERKKARDRYARVTAAGLCTRCEREPLVNATHCEGCREIHRQANRDSRAGLTRREPKSAQYAFAKARADHRKRHLEDIRRGKVGYVVYLERILREFRARTPEEFESWLVDKIEAMTARNLLKAEERAKLYQLAEAAA